MMAHSLLVFIHQMGYAYTYIKYTYKILTTKIYCINYTLISNISRVAKFVYISAYSASAADANALNILYACLYMLWIYWDVFIGILWLYRRTLFFGFCFINIL